MHTLALLAALAAQAPAAHTVGYGEAFIFALITAAVSVGVAYGLLKGKTSAQDDKIVELNDRVKAVEATATTSGRLEERMIALAQSVAEGFASLRRELENSGVYPRKHNHRDGE